MAERRLSHQPSEELPRLAQIRRQVGRVWGFRRPIRGRDRLDADFSTGWPYIRNSENSPSRDCLEGNRTGRMARFLAARSAQRGTFSHRSAVLRDHEIEPVRRLQTVSPHTAVYGVGSLEAEALGDHREHLIGEPFLRLGHTATTPSHPGTEDRPAHYRGRDLRSGRPTVRFLRGRFYPSQQHLVELARYLRLDKRPELPVRVSATRFEVR